MKKTVLLIALFCSMKLSAQELVASAPFELFGDHLFISLSVDDSEPVDFIFDTGDGLAVIDLDIAQNLNLKMDHKASKTSAQGSISGALIQHNKIEMDDVKIEDIELYTTDLDHLERSIGRNIDGIIGYDLLKNYVVNLDFDAMRINIYKPAGYAYTGAGQAVDFKLVNYIPTIEASVTLNNGESFKDAFFVNTGAATTMDFNTPFAVKHNVVDKTGEHYSYPVAGLEKEETMHYEGRVKEFTIGDYSFDDMPIGISQARHGIQHNKKAAGIIGSNVLRRFNLTFDYSRSKVYFEPNAQNEKPFSVNASGLGLQFGEGMEKLLVHQVFEGSPAKAAGIAIDAELVSIDGSPISSYTLPQVRELLKSSGKSVKLVYIQEGKEAEATLELKPLL